MCQDRFSQNRRLVIESTQLYNWTLLSGRNWSACCCFEYIITSFLIFIFSSPTYADWINLTGAENAANIAEIYITDDHIRMVLEIYVSDIEHFLPLTASHFQGIQMTTENGEQLKISEVTVLERRLRKDRYSPFKDLGTAIPWAITNPPPEDKRVYFAELVYQLNGLPAELTITPKLSNEGNAVMNIGFLVYHKNVPVIDFRYLSGAETLYLDWNDPWYTKFENVNLSRHHQSALSSYLYVEPYQVRHEIIIRPKDLTHWMDLQLQDKKHIDVNEFKPLLQRIGATLIQKNELVIDGKPVRPILNNVEYVDIGLYGIQTIKPKEKLELNSAIVGVMISYLTPGIPQKVAMKWDLFNEKIQQIPITTTDPAGPFLSYLNPDDNILVWNNYLKNFSLPTVKRVSTNITEDQSRHTLIIIVLLVIFILVLIFRRGKRSWGPYFVITILSIVGAMFLTKTNGQESSVKILNNKEANQTIETLLKNIYYAFLLYEEEDVYDKLALTTDGELLEQIYLQQRQALQLHDAGGAEARINDVKLLDIELRDSELTTDSLTYYARWTAEGDVSHWGHTHNRQNLYEADVTISAKESSWKISNFRILNEKRVF